MDKERNGFIDLHTHILPGVDDGAKSMEETIRMLRMANEEQITTIIATPHFASGAKNTPVEKLREVLEQVQKEAVKINNEMTILLGNEIYYSASVLDALNTKQALTLAGSRYVLVEFSPGETYQTIFRGLGGLVRGGYLPVIAHVERYRCLYRNEDYINELINLGCYLQMNCDSISGGFLDPEAIYYRGLVKQGLIHFLGTDCHDDKVRTPRMKRAVKQLLKRCDEGLIDKILYQHPIKVLENIYI